MSSLEYLPAVQTAQEIYDKVHDEKSLRTGCAKLDEFLGSSRSCITNGILELCGEAGTGKTLLCLSISVQEAKSLISNDGNSSNILYITTESQSIVERLAQLARLNTADEDAAAAVLKRILVKQLDHQSEIGPLMNLIENSIKFQSYSMIIIDSVTSLFQEQLVTSNISLVNVHLLSKVDYSARATQLFELSSRLKQLNSKYNITILVVNQVTSVIKHDLDVVRGQVDSISDSLKPALGLAWEQCVTTRIMLSNPRKKYIISRENMESGVISVAEKTLTIQHSPCFPSKSISYAIQEAGIVATN
jgi:RecA/RadA recombinase